MKNISVIMQYIKESINENILLDDEVELSYVDHLEKLKNDFTPEINHILKYNIYSSEHGGTLLYNLFNEIIEGYSIAELSEEGESALFDILDYLPEISYVEDGLNERIEDMIRYQIEELLECLISENYVSEDHIYQTINRFASSIANKLSLIYLKKKKILTDYIDEEDPESKIIDSLDSKNQREKVKSLIKIYVSDYYKNFNEDPYTSLESLKDRLSYFIDVY
tara:strand:- start:466 stop:1134 length:669 start_codon:yes stop_codon:yes gene_type:complete